MTKEKVIEGLEYLITAYAFHCDDAECLGEAVELLKEQEPIAPKKQEETRIWTVCGNCSQHLISKWAYCPYCGRKVKLDVETSS